MSKKINKFWVALLAVFTALFLHTSVAIAYVKAILTQSVPDRPAEPLRPTSDPPPSTGPPAEERTKFTFTIKDYLLAPFFWLFTTTPNQEPQLDIVPGPDATPTLPQGEVFINRLLVLGSGVGLVQNSTSTNFLGGWAYDTRNYLRVTQAAPNNPSYQAGIATDSTGAVHIYDASAGLPTNVRWQNGLPLTTSGQLCVTFG